MSKMRKLAEFAASTSQPPKKVSLTEKQAGLLARASSSCRLPVFTVARGIRLHLQLRGQLRDLTGFPFIPLLVPSFHRILDIVFWILPNGNILCIFCTAKKMPLIFFTNVHSYYKARFELCYFIINKPENLLSLEIFYRIVVY